MAQSQPDGLNMAIGRSTGNLRFCTSCGGNLELQDGTRANQTTELGGFQETYKCNNCGQTGEYRYRYRDAKETFTGCLAGSHMWE